MNPTILEKPLKGLTQSLLKRVCYLSKDKLYQFSTSRPSEHNNEQGNGLDLTDSKELKARVLILAREHYQELTELLPFGKGADLYKLVRRKAKSLGHIVLFDIGLTRDGKTPVTFYITRGLEPFSIQHCLVIPETLLLAHKLPDAVTVSYQTPISNKTVYVSKVFGHVVSGVQTPAISSPTLFNNQHGIGRVEHRTVSGPEVVDQLQHALWLTMSKPMGLYIVGSGNQQGVSWLPVLKLSALPIVAGVTLYLLGASQLSAYMLESAKSDFKQASTQANKVLILRSDTETNINRYQYLSQFNIDSEPALAIWQPLAHLYQQGVVFTRFNQTGPGLYQLQISAESATAALTYLVNHPQITSARFDGTVRKQRNREMATVVIEQSLLNATPVMEDDNG